MSLKHSPAHGVRPRYDDDDDLDVSVKRKQARSNTTLFVMLGAGALGFIFFAVVVGIASLAVLGVFGKPVEEKIVGSWKGRLERGGVASDHIYTFRKDGTFREEAFNLQGVRINVADGFWAFHDGEVEIDWHDGGFEDAVVRFIDDNTIEYRIVDHNDVGQIGTVMTFKRQ